MTMTLGYIDLKDICHLDRQSEGGGVYDDRKWRESYFYHMNDPGSGISIITTIGMLPNKGRSMGFLLVLKDGRVLYSKALVSLRRPSSDKYSFRLKGLEFSVEGVGWRLRFRSRKFMMDVRFTPINKIYPYIHGEKDDNIFERIGSQHYEQAGVFEGTLVLYGKAIGFGPCSGHRDHSWGIRDWSSVHHYRLFCCAFSKDLAFNLWEGRIGSRDFLKGYIFDGTGNTPIVWTDVRTDYRKDGRTPVRATVRVRGSNGRELSVQCQVLTCVPLPPEKCVIYETVSRMSCEGMEARGLLEYLYHEERPVQRAIAYLQLLAML